MGAFIKSIAYYLPDKIRSNAEISSKFPDWSAEKIQSKIGISQRHIADDDELASDLAVNACAKLFKENDIDKDCVDFILYCTQSPDYFLPTTACILQDKLGLRTNVGALDFNLGCSGYVYGLSLANGLIVSGAAKNILLVTSETYSKYIHPLDKSNLTIFGDAASATLISADDGLWEIKNFVFGTDGSGAENLIVKNGASKNRTLTGEDKEVDGVWDSNDNNLYMNGSEIFKFTASSVPKLVSEVLLKNNINIDEVDQFVFHQANKYMLDYIRKKIGIADNKFFTYLQNCGNTVSSTIPIALYEGHKSNEITLNDRILLAGFGVGYSWAGVILN